MSCNQWLVYQLVLLLLFQPDPEKASRDEEAEKEILEKVKATMTEEDLAELARATQELRLKQETPDPPEALKSVPSLSLSDIPKEPIRVPTEVTAGCHCCCNDLSVWISSLILVVYADWRYQWCKSSAA